MLSDREFSEAEQQWFILIMLGGALCYMWLATAIGIQALPFIHNVLERMFN